MAPNPIRESGVLRFSLSKPGRVDVRLFDVNGRVARVLADRGFFPAGAHELHVDQSRGPLNPGVYFYKIRTDEGNQEGSIVVAK